MKSLVFLKMAKLISVYGISPTFYVLYVFCTPSVPKVMLQAKSLKTRSVVSFGSFFIGLGMFVRCGNGSIMAVNITYKKCPPIFEEFRI